MFRDAVRSRKQHFKQDIYYLLLKLDFGYFYAAIPENFTYNGYSLLFAATLHNHLPYVQYLS